MESAVGDGERAQSRGLPEGINHPPLDPDERWKLLANWRLAIGQQLLTPAPDTAAVAWKKAALADGQFEYTGLKNERVERAIADDVAFLEAHPTRRSIAASRQSSGRSAAYEAPAPNGQKAQPAAAGGSRKTVNAPHKTLTTRTHRRRDLLAVMV